jgi:hypothetical protein
MLTQTPQQAAAETATLAPEMQTDTGAQPPHVQILRA